MTDETTGIGTTAIPCILECGYEQVWIEKSGRSFPAWKVSLQTGVWWRSKLDFLRLSRQSSVPLPKAAFRKLAEESPWHRSDSHHHRSVEQYNFNQWKPYMSKSLYVLEQFLVTVQRTHPQAWSQFCRTCDTKDLCSSDFIFNNSNNDRVNNSQSKQWGQYFCSNENAKQLVRVFMDLLVPLREQNKSEWVIMEPSCGHGTILKAFAQTLSQETTTWKIMGIDIDPKAISYCRDDPSMQQIQWEVANFLKSSKRDFGMDNEREYSAVVGNPPFHLAREFVKHAISEYRARVIVFILPRRLCSDKNDTWEEYSNDYECKHVQMESCEFHFQGDPSQTIKQPSSIQCLWKRN